MDEDADVSVKQMAAAMGVKKRKRKAHANSAEGAPKRARTEPPPAAPTPAPRNAMVVEECEELAELHLKLLDEKKAKVSLKDLQGLVLWLVGREGDMPKWIFVKNKSAVRQVVVVVLDSLSETLFCEFREEMPFLSNFIGQQVGTRLLTPKHDVKPNSFLQEFFSRDIYRKRPQGQGQGFSNSIGAALDVLREMNAADKPTAIASMASVVGRRGEPTPIPTIAPQAAVDLITSHYITPLETLIEAGFTVECTEGFVETKPSATPLPAEKRLYALDCEMCLTTKTHELTRISIIDWEGKLVYDQLVVPENEIVDYLTQYSGITATMLHDVTTRLEDVQQHLLKTLFFEETILMGHSLENDLKALKILHTNICDTTILYPHPQGLPLKNSLRFLSTKYLKRSVQGMGGHEQKQEGRVTGDSAHGIGHCSVEDAKAAMDLVVLKLEKGENFGVPSKKRCEAMLKHVEGRSMVLESPDTVHSIPSRESRADVIPIASDQEGFKKLKKAVKTEGKFALSFLHCHMLRTILETTAWAEEGEAQEDPDNETLKTVLSTLDASLKETWEQAAKNTVFIIMSGQTTGLKEVEGEETERFLDRWDQNRHGIAFLGVKPGANGKEE